MDITFDSKFRSYYKTNNLNNKKTNSDNVISSIRDNFLVNKNRSNATENIDEIVCSQQDQRNYRVLSNKKEEIYEFEDDQLVSSKLSSQKEEIDGSEDEMHVTSQHNAVNSPTLNEEDEYEIIECKSDSENETMTASESDNNSKSPISEQNALNTLRRDHARTELPLSNGPKVQVVGNNIFARTQENNDVYIKVAISPRSKSLKGPCIYEIGQTGEDGNIDPSKPKYIGSSEKGCLEAGKSLARDATNPAKRSGPQYRKVAVEVYNKGKENLRPRNLSAQFEQADTSSLRIHAIATPPLAELQRQTEEAITGRLGTSDWNMTSQRDEIKKSKATKAIESSKKVTDFFKRASGPQTPPAPAPKTATKRKAAQQSITSFFQATKQAKT